MILVLMKKINPYDLIHALSELIAMEGSRQFFEEIIKLEDDPELFFEGTLIGFRFTNGYKITLKEFMGTIFGSFRDQYSNNSAQVWNQAKGREMYNKLLDLATMPVAA